MKRVPVEMRACRWMWLCVAMVVASAIALSCGSAPAQAPDATATAPEQVPDPEPTPILTATPKPVSAPRANAGATPSPSPTATPAVSEEQASAPEPAATSTEQSADDDSPVGDCFGGVLSEDPLHCYVLEQAQAEGLISILGMYESGGLLFVSISQDELSDELIRFSWDKSHAFAEARPELVPEKKYGRFLSTGCKTFPKCYLISVQPDEILPVPSAYKWVEILPGGDAARRQEPGWASWRQVWPAAASGTSGASGSSDTFDVSGVNMTNLPDGTSEFGFTASHGDGRGTNYVQIKNPPTDKAALHRLMQEIDPCYDIDGVCTWGGADGKRYTNRIEFISVKYSWEELNRWTEILNRFAVSSGNTIGITRARMGDNSYGLFANVIYVNGMKPPPEQNQGPVTSGIRTTILLFVLGDLQRAADALPVLLPLLGIPVDAVGVIGQDYSH